MPVRIKDIFLDALDQPASDREAWLARECPDDAMRQRVIELLAAHDVAPTFAPPKADSALLDPAATRVEDIGDAIGEDDKYILVRRLGEGGFGVVFLAQQRHPVERPVALKLLKIASDGSQIAARFDAERQTLARMDHPQIARVFDAGATERGRPYFVMEYVDGQPITGFCYGRQMLLVERLELFAKVCMAVQHAHGKGVIHRDLKPGNILVTLVDGRPVPKVIDFGIAKAIDPLADVEGDAPPQMTLEAQIIGTPQYMAPEQATLGRKYVDTRSDIYSLGTVLYELIASSPPFDPEELRRAGLDEVCRIVRERVPTRPSTRIATDTNWPTVRRRKLSRLVAGEVDWIVMRAMEKEPDRRYATAAELADDLRRFIRHEPVHARPPSQVYAAQKFIRRHRPEVALASLAAAALLGVAVVATVKERQARDARDLARRNESTAIANATRARDAEQRAVEQARHAATELSRADAIATFARQLLAGIGPSVARGRDSSLLKDLLDIATRNADPSLARQPTIDLIVRTMIAQAQYDLGDYDAAARTLRPSYDATRASVRDSPERLRAGTLLASILSESGDAAGALTIGQETSDGYERIGDGRSADALSARIAFASTLRRSRRYADALAIDEGVLAQLVAVDAGDDELGLRVRNAIASLLVDLHRPLEALARWQDVLAIQQRRHGSNHPGTLATMSNLAVVYDRTGRPDLAERYDRLVLEQERRIYAPGHPNLVKTLNNLAAVLLNVDRVDEAAACLDEASAIVAARPESTRRFARPLMVQTAELRMRQGRPDDAIAIATALRDDYAAEFGPNGARTLGASGVLLGCLADAGRFDEASRVLAGIDLDALPHELPDEQHAILHAVAAQVLFGLGKPAEATRSLDAARVFTTPVEEGGALLARRLAKVVAATQPTTRVADR